MIELQNIHLTVGNFSLAKVSFHIPSGKYCTLMGKTGCGKTTILEAICGLRGVRGGNILLDDRDVTRLKPAQRQVGYVPQDGALFTTMKVREQLGFALSIRRVAKSEIKNTVDHMAGLLEIEHLLDRTPKGLSGGEMQRIALGRALAFGPRILCLDEPLSALDSGTKVQITKLLKRIQTETQVTVLHVTHNLEEAETLADVRLSLIDGKIVDGSPQEATS